VQDDGERDDVGRDPDDDRGRDHDGGDHGDGAEGGERDGGPDDGGDGPDDGHGQGGAAGGRGDGGEVGGHGEAGGEHDADDDYDAGFDPGGFDDDLEDGGSEPLDEHESAMVEQDLSDLADLEATFRGEGYRGVSLFCQDCVEEHYYPWDMLRENLTLLLQTGETPVHEPAFEPDPERYVPWEYARGYVDALRDVGVADRLEVDRCSRCGLQLPTDLRGANFCPRCGETLLRQRLPEALAAVGLDEDTVGMVLRRLGLPGRP
jgi:hypothetical protein